MARFISVEIDAVFDKEPVIKKRAGPPDAFWWGDERFEVREVIAEWHDYDKKRREAGETRRSQVQLNRQHGSWGTGRDTTACGQTRAGSWSCTMTGAPRTGR